MASSPRVCAALALLLLAVATPGQRVGAQAVPSTPTAHDPSAKTGLHLEPAPDFTRSDIAGKTVRLSEYRGKVVLLNFWATWCPPCLDEIPAFSTWQQEYRAEGLQVVGVSMDDDIQPVQRAVIRYHVVYPVVMSDDKLVKLYGGVLGLPLSFIIDPSGRIVARFQGKADLARMKQQLTALLPHQPR